MSSLTTEPAALAFVMQCIAETPDVYVRPGADLTRDTRLRDDLGIDSIGLVSLLYAVADALSVEADENATQKLLTLGDVIDLARALEAVR